jgi:hypothetical protein
MHLTTVKLKETLSSVRVHHGPSRCGSRVHRGHREDHVDRIVIGVPVDDAITAACPHRSRRVPCAVTVVRRHIKEITAA